MAVAIDSNTKSFCVDPEHVPSKSVLNCISLFSLSVPLHPPLSILLAMRLAYKEC